MERGLEDPRSILTGAAWDRDGRLEAIQQEEEHEPATSSQALAGHGRSLLALTVALGGTIYEAIRLPKNSVGTKRLRKTAVTHMTLPAPGV
jgi:hypothetical protein